MSKTTRRGLAGRLLGLAAGAAVMAGIGTAAQADHAAIPESEDPIVIAINEWTGQHITAYVGGTILEKMGYNVEYVTAGVLTMAPALSDGQLTLGMEMWDNNLGDTIPKYLSEGKIVDAGDVGLDAREGWLYPVHVKELCPGLPDWDAFLGCSDIFATPETFPDGRLLAYPADWGHRSADIIEGTGIPFQAVPAGSEGALVAELNSAVERESPLVMMFWAPHWVLFHQDVEWIDMPQDIVNTYGLQKPRIFRIAWPGMQDKWPAAWEFILNYRISNAAQEEMMGKIDNQGMDLVEVTTRWVEDNEDVWKPMVEQAMHEMHGES